MLQQGHILIFGLRVPRIRHIYIFPIWPPLCKAFGPKQPCNKHGTVRLADFEGAVVVNEHTRKACRGKMRPTLYTHSRAYLACLAMAFSRLTKRCQRALRRRMEPFSLKRFLFPFRPCSLHLRKPSNASRDATCGMHTCLACHSTQSS